MSAQQPLEALKKAKELGTDIRDFFAMNNPVCPHCGAAHEISQAGTYRLYEEGEHDLTCEVCDLDFTVSTRVNYSFNTDNQEAG